ncbi:MAG: single-stranded-DNA-specific exonuclease RecJ [Desulfosalsimonadaceae bacterium]
MNKHLNWLNPDEKLVRSIQRKAGCLPVTAAVLANRGIVGEQAIRSFMNPSLQMIHRGFSMAGMERAVERIAEAVKKKEKVLVFGDYDVDGVTATTLLLGFFRQCGLEAAWHIPHRLAEGYGLKTFHIEQVAKQKGIDLIITVDCGSGSHEAVLAASQAGIDTIITDHHSIDDPPAALAVINPQRCDCPAGTNCLAGVGVAFYLLVCLRKHLRAAGFWEKGEEPNLKACCDLVALGTIADIVPLVEENRILTRTGLEVINSCPRPGIQALIEVSGIKKPALSAEDVAFRLAPRINAAGRLDHAGLAVELLQTSSTDRAREIAGKLNKCNTERQTVENRIFRRICMHLDEQPGLLERNTLVLAGNGWHEGVLGIVASRLVQRFWRPVVVLSFSGDMANGSARSIAPVNLYEAVSACADFLESYGGHPMAAGLRMKKEHLEGFREAFESAVSEMAAAEEFSPEIDIDAAIDFAMISDRLVNELESLQPFGPENEEPLFCVRDVDLVRAIPVGEGHRKLIVRQSGRGDGRTFEGIWFNMPEACKSGKNFAELVFRLRWNYWNGSKRVQLMIEDGRTE